jgi:hypothetical protein
MVVLGALAGAGIAGGVAALAMSNQNPKSSPVILPSYVPPVSPSITPATPTEQASAASFLPAIEQAIAPSQSPIPVPSNQLVDLNSWTPPAGYVAPQFSTAH